MRNQVTTRDELLQVSRRLVCCQGWSAVNIRSIAAECGISVGSVYHYFASKQELAEATGDSIWQEIFCRPEDDRVMGDILEFLTWVYRRMELGAGRYPGFFTLHSAEYLRMDGQDQQRTGQHRQYIHDILCQVLRADSAIRGDAFDDSFTREQFAHVLFSLIFASLLQGEHDPRPVVEMARRTLYRQMER